VAKDVREGVVTREAARDVYAVVLSASGDVDEAATVIRRSGEGAARPVS
jgi:hypothetical protein